LAGARRQFVDREVERLGAEQRVLAGYDGGRRDAEALAIILDRCGEVGDSEAM
jgi:hypothetical protein